MRLSKARTSSSRPRRAKSCITTRPSCWTMATAGKPRSPATSSWMHRTDERRKDPVRADDAAGAGDGEGLQSVADLLRPAGVREDVADHAESPHGDVVR